jgi:hypothetical protein
VEFPIMLAPTQATAGDELTTHSMWREEASTLNAARQTPV